MDKWLNVPDNFRWILKREKAIDSWHGQCADWIDSHPFKEHRKKQYRHMVSKKPFKFVMTKQQTRYRQKNYRRYSYKKSVVVDSERFTFDYLVSRHDELERLTENTCTLKQFYSNKQRGLMKAPLKQLIAERDNYTCQICGKYMPDGVGLQIDHIVPVSRGGKSVPSNLRVLCSKCNEKKGNKLDNEWNVKEWKESI